MIFNRILILSTFLCFLAFGIQAQNEIYHIEPPYWWTNMNNPYLEIMIHGENIGPMQASIGTPKIKIIDKVSKHRNFIFLYVDLTTVEDIGYFDILLQAGDRKITIPYELKDRTRRIGSSPSVTAKDAIYLITPDRYRNSDTSNDNVAEFKESLNRSDDYGRHGGDIQGINESLNYIKKLGFNTVWLNPVLENDMKSQSYHGYATTDYYTVDSRFGGNLEYFKLRDSLEAKGMKLIMDMIVNHCGSEHWWMYDMPFPDWLNYQEEYIKNREEFSQYSNHRKSSIHDPYASEADKALMVDGWFVRTMPDLNQRNEHMARYLIQNSIWWVETMHLSGIRQDTYPYADESFLTEWTCGLMYEFPDLFIVGEEWNHNPLIASYWQGGENAPEKLSSTHSCLPSVMDFPLQNKVKNGLVDEENWNSGLASIYEHMVNDILYPNPKNLVIFPDNHDMDRVYTQMNNNYSLWQANMIYYATMRGIPQLYYGTEILMSNSKPGDHGEIRTEMPGGWDDHSVSAFETKGLTKDQKLAYIYLSRLYNWRSSSKVIHEGKLIHYVPNNGIYVYFRTLGNNQVMVILNKNNEDKILDVSRFNQMLQGYETASNVITFEKVKIREPLKLKAGESYVFEMEK